MIGLVWWYIDAAPYKNLKERSAFWIFGMTLEALATHAKCSAFFLFLFEIFKIFLSKQSEFVCAQAHFSGRIIWRKIWGLFLFRVCVSDFRNHMYCIGLTTVVCPPLIQLRYPYFLFLKTSNFDVFVRIRSVIFKLKVSCPLFG